MLHAIYLAIDIFRHRKEYDEASLNPLPKLYHEKKDDSDKVRYAIPKKRDGRNQQRHDNNAQEKKSEQPKD